MITNGAKPLLFKQTSGHRRSKAFTGGVDKWSAISKTFTNGAVIWSLNGLEPLLAEQTCNHQRSNAFTDGADT